MGLEYYYVELVPNTTYMSVSRHTEHGDEPIYPFMFNVFLADAIAKQETLKCR